MEAKMTKKIQPCPGYAEFVAKYGNRPPDIVYAVATKDGVLLICAEIEKLKNPYSESSEESSGTYYRVAYEKARQDILKMLREVRA